MKSAQMEDVSNILDTFNMEDIRSLFQKQIMDVEDVLATHPTNHFKPLYYKYKCIMETEENTEEVKEAAEKRFEEICNILLDLICNKFNLIFDKEWREDNYNNIAGYTMALYSFFVLDFPSNIQEVCLNYIQKNKKDIYDVFEEKKNKKDATTMVNKRNMTPEMVVIISNIYNITTWILSNMSEESFISHINQDYAPISVISTLLENGVLTGEFMTSINDQYATNVELKSGVCFDLITILENGGK